ncbi:unnamed protein product [Rotaria sordida]|uniref:Uncharacterized protein n=1 Tax=Rotaria sordida TaxID=392033 RepID=A0A813SE42_9BILA|nr:unnamed protein product [Rotaria sordida]
MSKLDRSTSTTNSQFETNPTHIDTDFSIHDTTANTYKVLDKVLNATNPLESTTLSHEKPSTSITMTSPTEHIHLSSSNLSFNSTSSSAASTDSTVEAIVAKYLSPKQSATLKTAKRLIRRPYGVSITDLDVYGESIMKQPKKNNNKLVNKKSTTSGENESSKKCSNKTKSLTEKLPDVHNSQMISSMNDSSSQRCHYDYNVLDSSLSTGLQNPTCHLLFSNSTSHVLRPLQNVSTSICGNCHQYINILYVGGYCSQCNVPICWSCWSSENLHLLSLY